MTSVNYLQVKKGKYLAWENLEITDAQIILSEPKTIGINIWRNDEKTEKQFEIEIHMPWGSIYTIASYDTEEKAEKEYKKMVEQLKNYKAKINIGKSVSLSFNKEGF